MAANEQIRKRSVAFLLFVLVAVPLTLRAQSSMELLLQHLDARPEVFRKFATASLKFSFAFTSLYEGGLIGEDTFRRGELTLVKSYGYYALLESGDRKLRKRLGLTLKGAANWRDSAWNTQRERDWTGITLSTSSDSLAQTLLQEAMNLGAQEVQPCLRLTKVDEVEVEQMTYALNNNYTIVFRKYAYCEGVRHEVRLALCSFD